MQGELARVRAPHSQDQAPSSTTCLDGSAGPTSSHHPLYARTRFSMVCARCSELHDLSTGGGVYSISRPGYSRALRCVFPPTHDSLPRARRSSHALSAAASCVASTSRSTVYSSFGRNATAARDTANAALWRRVMKDYTRLKEDFKKKIKHLSVHRTRPSCASGTSNSADARYCIA